MQRHGLPTFSAAGRRSALPERAISARMRRMLPPSLRFSHLFGACAFALGVGSVPAALAGEPASGLPTSAAAATTSQWRSGAEDVALYALGLLGVSYRFGGNSPDAGLDCSGLVRYVFQEVTGVMLPRTSKEMAGLGAKVAAADLQPGDLVFFNTRRFHFSHVGIYLGENRFIHAPSSGSEVAVAQLSGAYWRRHFSGARRLAGVLPGLVSGVIAPAAAQPAPAGAGRADLP